MGDEVPMKATLLYDSLEREGYIESDRVRKAMETVPRELFVDENYRRMAYEDRPLPIGHGQTISAPHMVAMMCELIDARPGHRILEVGAGCGYHAAVMSRLVLPDGMVYTTEIVAPLAELARSNLDSAGITNVVVVHSDGSVGMEEEAPFDRIFVAAASPDIPPPLLDQLAPGGILVIPVGGMGLQELIVVRKREDGTMTTEYKGGVVFVPLRGKHGI